jgi:hypothetical protein
VSASISFVDRLPFDVKVINPHGCQNGKVMLHFAMSLIRKVDFLTFKKKLMNGLDCTKGDVSVHRAPHLLCCRALEVQKYICGTL